MGFLFIFPLLIVILAVLASCIRIVPQAQALVVERLGAYLDTWSVGVHFLVPFVDRVAKKVSLKEQVVDFAPTAGHHQRQCYHADRYRCVFSDHRSEAVMPTVW